MRMSKVELLAELHQVRHIWVDYDAERLKEHRQAEKDALKDWKDKLRVALKADYKTAKNDYAGFSGRNLLTFNSPPCPISRVDQIDRLIKEVELSNQKVYTITPHGANYRYYQALMDRPDEPKDLCDD